MTGLFKTVLDMSITGSVIICAVMLLRLLLKNLPKKYSYALWIIPAIRLLCPVSVSAAVSFFNLLKPVVNENRMTYIPPDIEYSPAPEITLPAAGGNVNVPLESLAPNVGDSVNPLQIVFAVCSVLWVIGALAVIIISAVTYIRVYRKVRFAVKKRGYYLCDNIDSPFVFGIIDPKIYIPESVSDTDLSCILAHENAHIRRFDHIVKLVCIPVMALHWFNPFMWIGIKFMTKDMELSCDEAVLKNAGTDYRKTYANALLNMSLKQNKISFGVLNFGESDIKSRVKGALKVKKNAVIISIIAVVTLIIISVCMLTNAENSSEPVPSGSYVTDKLLYSSPSKNSYWGDDNGVVYTVNNDKHELSLSRSTFGEPTSIFSISEPSEFPFTEKEWSEIYDSAGFADKELSLKNYHKKSCQKLSPISDGGIESPGDYLFKMDSEIWFVQGNWEIYRLKPVTDKLDRTYSYVSEAADLNTALTFERQIGSSMLCMNINIPSGTETDNGKVLLSDKTEMLISPFFTGKYDINDINAAVEKMLESEPDDLQHYIFTPEYEDGLSGIILFKTTDDDFTYDKAAEIVATVKFMHDFEEPADVPAETSQISSENETKLFDDLDAFNEQYKGVHGDTIHQMFGLPQGILSGFSGDIYYNSDNAAVIIYYDYEGYVDHAELGGWSKPEEGNSPDIPDNLTLERIYTPRADAAPVLDADGNQTDRYALVQYILPEEWQSEDCSAYIDGVKMFEYNVFEDSEINYDGYKVDEALGREVTVISKEYRNDEIYDYMIHRTVGGTESYMYVIRKEGYIDDVYMITAYFYVNENYDEAAVSRFLKSLSTEEYNESRHSELL